MDDENHEQLREEVCAELGIKNPERAESDGTFTFQNLNYAKQKLLDPEIKYLSKKFEEQLLQIKNDLV
jgi:hypothetical protein